MEDNKNTNNNIEIKEESTSTGLSENIAGMLTYLAGFITGIIFLIIEKENRFVRYHAIQSIGISVFLLVLNRILLVIPLLGWVLSLLIAPVTLVIWIILLYKSYQGSWFKLPIFGDIALKEVDKVR